MTEPESLVKLASYRIRLLEIAFYKSFEKVITGYGTAPRYFGLLKIIQANPGSHQTQLAEAVFLDRSSLVPIIDTLKKEGWIERRPAPNDRRLRRIFLTDEGARKLDSLERQVLAHEATVTAGLTPDEIATLLDLLARIDRNLRSALAPSPTLAETGDPS
ncbi:MAG: MarR family winged helix-turn-helix transcriptional regulator [Qingshengfaniella sp.]